MPFMICLTVPTGRSDSMALVVAVAACGADCVHALCVTPDSQNGGDHQHENEVNLSHGSLIAGQPMEPSEDLINSWSEKPQPWANVE